ncbi:MAG: hypothetical protein WA864_08590 [Acetobacteraceae bacterium]
MTGLGGALLVAAALAAVIALEVSNPPSDDVERLQTRSAVATPPILSTTTSHMNDWVAITLARPLFSPDRRPTADAVTVASGRTVPGLPRLAGILVGPFGRSAIFATNGAKPIVVQEGGRVAAYTIKSIEATQVRLLGPDGAQVLYPSFEPAAAPARRPAGQAPLSR